MNFKIWAQYVCFSDINSRYADLNDYIKGVDNLSDGEVVDFQVNKYGHILLDFLINSNLYFEWEKQYKERFYKCIYERVICCGLLFCQPF